MFNVKPAIDVNYMVAMNYISYELNTLFSVLWLIYVTFNDMAFISPLYGFPIQLYVIRWKFVLIHNPRQRNHIQISRQLFLYCIFFTTNNSSKLDILVIALQISTTTKSVKLPLFLLNYLQGSIPDRNR